MEYRIAAAGRKTGALLRNLVGPLANNAVVCYGTGYSGPLPSLNGACGRLNKLEQAQLLFSRMGSNAIQPLDFEQAYAVLRSGEAPMLLGRKIHHAQGRDIVPIIEQWQLEDTHEHVDFYTPYVRSTGEYRTWVYRNRHLGTYRKMLAEPENFKRFGRNRKNGFVFDRVENDEVHDGIKDAARQAIAALGLDFGAVDILRTDEPLDQYRFVVLEVNAAPGVQDERRAVIQNLAHRIQRWAANGCPGRAA